jgi:hypothetical protein
MELQIYHHMKFQGLEIKGTRVTYVEEVREVPFGMIFILIS